MAVDGVVVDWWVDDAVRVATGNETHEMKIVNVPNVKKLGLSEGSDTTPTFELH